MNEMEVIHLFISEFVCWFCCWMSNWGRFDVWTLCDQSSIGSAIIYSFSISFSVTTFCKSQSGTAIRTDFIFVNRIQQFDAAAIEQEFPELREKEIILCAVETCAVSEFMHFAFDKYFTVYTSIRVHTKRCVSVYYNSMTVQCKATYTLDSTLKKQRETASPSPSQIIKHIKYYCRFLSHA